MAYNPDSTADRIELATRVEQTLLNAGFFEEWHGEVRDPTKEKTYTRQVVDGIRIVVYTSIVGDRVRSTGKDAIRVVLVYTSERLGKDRGIGKETRIHRTGEVSAILERMLTRMRNAWTAGKRPCRCPQCNAPTFKAKSGKDVCADLCWKTTEELEKDTYQRRSTYRPRPAFVRRSRW